VFRGQVNERRPLPLGLFSPVNVALTDLAFRLAALGYVAFSLADLLTTSYALNHGALERNPVAASLYQSYGIAGLFAVKAAAVAAIVLTLRFMPRRPAVWLGTVFAAVMAVVVAANVGAIAPR
jgi:hypothetical protein